MNAVWVFLGGGTGAVLRWSLGLALGAPWGTLVVNVVGSLGLAFLSHPATGVGDAWRLALGTGLMGGFTTYSTFNQDVLSALQQGDTGRAATLAATTLLVCLISGAAGWWLAGALQGGA